MVKLTSIVSCIRFIKKKTYEGQKQSLQNVDKMYFADLLLKYAGICKFQIIYQFYRSYHENTDLW